MTIDHQDIRILDHEHILGPGSPIRLRLRSCLRSRLELRSIQGIMLPHRNPCHCVRSRHFRLDLHT